MAPAASMVVRPRQSVCGDGGDRPAADADISNGVEVRLGIEHPAVGDHEVEGLPAQQRQRQHDHRGGGSQTAQDRIRMLIDHAMRRIIPVP